ncbi:hypothetical protein AALP_AA5G114900 [Arabis alpina]|uniref:Uncharacterized protein n=1 Tax=Arabis alpina TaxID=50452 RepID=A0A087GWF6_ARAAL|nr:hypothetical protein AALP_AA5G114900 [Arabis alpina]
MLLTQATVNDVILGVTQAGLSRYLERRFDGEETTRNSNVMPKRIRLRAALLVNIRHTTGDLADMMVKGSKCRWGNWFGYKTINRKKNSFGAMLTYIMLEIIK